MLFADMHSHFLLNAYYLGRPFNHGGRDRFPFGPFGNRLDLEGCLEGGLRCLTFTAYVPFAVSEVQAYVAQLRLVERIAQASSGKVVVARTGAQARAVAESGRLAAVLAVEGGHSIGKDLRNLRELGCIGARMLTITHFVANALGDSSQSPYKPHGGLSAFGRKAVREMQGLGIIPDVAHLSDDGVRQVLDMATGPIVCSHTGMRALCPIPRNLPDDLARAIARTGGLVGVVLFPPYLEHRALRVPFERFLDHVVHAAHTVGPEHVAIGSDFDGWTWTPDGFRGPRDMSMIAEGLVRRGFSDSEIAAICFENYLRLLDQGMTQVPL